MALSKGDTTRGLLVAPLVTLSMAPLIALVQLELRERKFAGYE